VSLGIVPFLLVAFGVLYPCPSDVGRLFAWPIKPTMTAMVLGSVYLGGAYFFLRAYGAKQWHTIKGGFLSVGTFASLLGIATILHWDRFIHAHLAFWLWAGLYFTTPFLVFAVWWRNRLHEAPLSGSDVLIPLGVARLIALCGGLALATGAFLFFFPGRAVSIWPWAVTPLTARVLGAIFCLGLAGLGAPFDRRWSSARILFQVAGLMLSLILVAAVRLHGEFDTSRPLTGIFLVGFASVFASMALLYVRMEARSR